MNTTSGTDPLQQRPATRRRSRSGPTRLNFASTPSSGAVADEDDEQRVVRSDLRGRSRAPRRRHARGSRRRAAPARAFLQHDDVAGGRASGPSQRSDERLAPLGVSCRVLRAAARARDDQRVALRRHGARRAPRRPRAPAATRRRSRASLIAAPSDAATSTRRRAAPEAAEQHPRRSATRRAPQGPARGGRRPRGRRDAGEVPGLDEPSAEALGEPRELGVVPPWFDEFGVIAAGERPGAAPHRAGCLARRVGIDARHAGGHADLDAIRAGHIAGRESRAGPDACRPSACTRDPDVGVAHRRNASSLASTSTSIAIAAGGHAPARRRARARTAATQRTACRQNVT